LKLSHQGGKLGDQGLDEVGAKDAVAGLRAAERRQLLLAQMETQPVDKAVVMHQVPAPKLAREALPIGISLAEAGQAPVDGHVLARRCRAGEANGHVGLETCAVGEGNGFLVRNLQGFAACLDEPDVAADHFMCVHGSGTAHSAREAEEEKKSFFEGHVLQHVRVPCHLLRGSVFLVVRLLSDCTGHTQAQLQLL
jgi:hypothetical protein